MSDNKLIFKNTFFLFITNFLNVFSSFVVSILLARKSLPTNFGDFSTSQNYANLLLIIADFGLSTLIVVNIARNKAKVNEYLPKIYSFKYFLCLVYLIISYTMINIIHYSTSVRVLVYITAFAYMCNSLFLFYSNVLRALEVMEYETYINMLVQTLLVLLCMVAIYVFNSVIFVAIAYLIETATAVVVSVAIFRKKNITLKIKIDFSAWRDLVKDAMPFGFHQLFGYMYLLIDTFLLGVFYGSESVAYYSATTKILVGLNFITDTIMGVMMPVLSRYYSTDKSKLVSFYKVCLKLMWTFSIFLSVEMFFNSGNIITFLYKNKYDNSIPILMVLSFLVVFRFVGNVPAVLLTSLDLQKYRFYIVILGTVINVILNLLLIPKFNYMGAAYSALLTNAILCIVHFVIVFRKVGYKTIGINPIKIVGYSLILIFAEMGINKFLVSNLFIKGIMVFILAIISTILVGIFSKGEIIGIKKELKRG
ncbi:MAG: flippase [Bacillota bacterium]|nr:flippase [Bacillota bacterium]